MNAFVVRMSNKKRESGDSESTHGVVKEPGAFEMMDDFSVLSVSVDYSQCQALSGI